MTTPVAEHPRRRSRTIEDGGVCPGLTAIVRRAVIQ
jgi:hypothetical protein